MKLVLSVLFFIISEMASAAIPRSLMILNRTAENSGNGIYQIELELQFFTNAETSYVHETWMIENENNYKILVSGQKDLKDSVNFFIQVTNGQKTLGLNSSKKIGEDFIERYHHLRSPETLFAAMNFQKAINPQALNKRVIRALKDVDHSPEPLVRLAKSSGVVTYAFGTPSSESEMTPGFWIEQDQFLLRKFRLQTGVEVSSSGFASFAKGLQYPKQRTIRWGGQSVAIQTLNVVSKTKDQYFNFKPAVSGSSKNQSLGPVFVEEFYLRFR